MCQVVFKAVGLKEQAGDHCIQKFMEETDKQAIEKSM